MRIVQVTTLNHKYFRTHIEDCLGLGKPLLIENIEQELDPCLDNVLSKNLVKSGTMFKVNYTHMVSLVWCLPVWLPFVVCGKPATTVTLVWTS